MPRVLQSAVKHSDFLFGFVEVLVDFLAFALTR